MRMELVPLICFVAFIAGGCAYLNAGKRKPTKDMPYIAQRASDGLWIYRLDTIAGVTHESALRFKDALACRAGYTRFRSMLTAGVEPIIRTDSNRATLERWHIEDGQGGAVDNAEQGFQTPSAAMRNFKSVKRAVVACPDPVIRTDKLP